MRVLLCVEGSRPPRGARPERGIEDLWAETIGGALGPEHQYEVLPVSKRDYEALDNDRVVGGTPLSIRLADAIEQSPPDAIVLVWDLLPPWGVTEDAIPCRWTECLRVLRCLSDDDALPQTWRAAAKRRLDDYEARADKSSSRRPRLTPGSIELVCVEKEFESILLFAETEIRSALQLRGKPAPGWPKWPGKALNERHPKDVLARAVRLASPAVARKIHGDFRTHMHDWEAFMIKHLLGSVAGRHALTKHEAWQRLETLLAAAE